MADDTVADPATGRSSHALLQRKTHRLLALPGVRNAVALGVPDEEHGEAVQISLATAEGGADVDPEAVGAAVTAELGELYTPRKNAEAQLRIWASAVIGLVGQT
ncbi:AMP-binding enzyme [Streptomyces sp. WAC01526]|uniref:AMP-binding enzyme n=1 Tax=Streptomyces sp. WAC01526 TaxID=2588709 RepID=UPI0021CCA7F2|nr:hypothetical protein [Streptomyces sp. WAC01526]